MAYDLVARLRLKDDLSSRMRKVTGELGRAEKQTRSLSERVGGLKSVMAGLGVSLGAVTIGKAIAGIGIEFDSQMSKVKAISGATEAEFKKLTATARQLGRDTVFSATESAQGMEKLALAGWKTEAIIKAMPGMLNLAAAGALDLATASDITSDVMQSFGLSAEKAGHTADVFAYAQANANTNVEQLGEAMKYLAPVANALGWELEESSAAMMAVADSGIKGSMGGQAFATSLARLAKPTKKMNEEMSRLGMTLFDTKGDLKTLPQVVGELEKATKGMTAEQRSSTITTLFGAQAYKHWAVLLERGSGALEDTTKKLKVADGTAAAMAETMLDNVAGSFKLLKSAAEDVAIGIWNKFKPAVKGSLDQMTEFVTKLPAAGKSLMTLLKPFKEIGKAALIFAGAIATIFTFQAAFALIGAAISFLVSPLGLAAAAVTALYYGFKALYKNSEPFRAFVDGAVGALKGLFAVLKGDKTSAFNLMHAAGLKQEQISKIRDFGDKVKEAYRRVTEAFSAVKSGNVGDVVKAFGFSPDKVGKVVAFVDGIKAKASEIVGFLAGKWAELQPGIATLVGLFDTAKAGVMTALSALWGYVQPVFSALGTAFKIVADIAVMAFNNIIAPALKFAVALFKMLWSVASPILSILGTQIALAFGVLKIVWDTILKPVAEFLMTVFKGAFEVATGVVETIGGMFDWLGDKISGVIGWFQDLAGKMSAFKPPEWMSKIGSGVANFVTGAIAGPKIDGSFYHGIDSIPYDGFVATLHKGERVQTAQEVRESKNGGNEISINIANMEVREEADIDRIAGAIVTKIIAAREAGA